MDTQQPFGNPAEIDKLRLKNAELKKELEREQVLHNMLYKEWKELSEQMAAKEQQVYEDSKPKNLFYKYAFYVFIIALIPAGYFLYPLITGGSQIAASTKLVADSSDVKDTTSAIAAAPAKDSIKKKDAEPTVQAKPVVKDNAQQTAQVTPPVIKPVEKKVILPDSTQPAKLITRKPVVETPLTEDGRDSISSLGFSAYFDHHRNPFRRSSERYKIWAQGWNEGREEANKITGKDSSAKR